MIETIASKLLHRLISRTMKEWSVFLLLMCAVRISAFATAPQRRSFIACSTTPSLIRRCENKDRVVLVLHPLCAKQRQLPERKITRLNAAAATAAAAAAPVVLSSSSTFLVRIVFLRALALVYGVSFMIALSQNKALIGDNGITPAKRVLDQAQAIGTFKRNQRLEWRKDGTDSTTNEAALLLKSGWRRFVPKRPRIGRMIGRAVDRNEKLLKVREVLWDRSDRADRPVTTLLWLAKDRNELNPWLDQLAVNGLALSAAVAVTGAANVPILLTMWLCHRSLMAVGGPWYGFGWEPQLAELGFHALFCVPLLSLNPLIPVQIPAAVHWCIRWHLFRVRTTVLRSSLSVVSLPMISPDCD